MSSTMMTVTSNPLCGGDGRDGSFGSEMLDRFSSCVYRDALGADLGIVTNDRRRAARPPGEGLVTLSGGPPDGVKRSEVP